MAGQNIPNGFTTSSNDPADNAWRAVYGSALIPSLGLIGHSNLHLPLACLDSFSAGGSDCHLQDRFQQFASDPATVKLIPARTPEIKRDRSREFTSHSDVEISSHTAIVMSCDYGKSLILFLWI